jgi:hypothetical protein
MTASVLEFKCPTCGHLIGEQEYKDACDELSKKIQESSYKQIQFLEDEYTKQIEKIEEHHQHEIESKAKKDEKKRPIDTDSRDGKDEDHLPK